MGKRKQQQIAVFDSAVKTLLDIVETDRSTDLPKSNCQHVARSVELNHIKKTLKSENLKSISCSICSKEGVPPKKEENWVCLQCGARQCSLEHLKNHFNVPRSDLHTIAFSLNNFTIWCDLCNTNIREEDSKKLKICVGYIKQMMDKSKQVLIVETPYNDDVPPPLVEWNDSNESENTNSNVLNKRSFNHRPSVRGLVNLGNTCFFNSVLQCLARTPKLVETLRRMESEEEHISITLNNGQLLEGKLGKSGDWLGQCLADILVALCRPGDTLPENPLKLLQVLRKKCPQFEGYDQHDSHELLRHLLDNVRQNDLKRYRALMLSELGLSRKVNPQDVSAELTKKVKALDNEVIDKVTLVPDHVFRGLLVSTLECQDCHNTSECVESFSDLSLPIMADKPLPPSIRRKGSASPELVDDEVSTSGGGLSKYQQKKQAKQARKKARNKHGQKTAVTNSLDGSLPNAPDSHSDKGESEADVEDNEEDKPHESGYSSEKIPSESSSLSGGDDSARTSPTTHVKEERIGNTGIKVCEGLPTISCLPGSPSDSLIPQPVCESAPRIRRKPDADWINNGGSFSPSWIPHSDTTYIPNPVQIIEGGESWRSYAPREGLVPSSVRSQKDSLNPIVEEIDKNVGEVKTENSVCDQVSLMSKVVETMLAQVHISQELLDNHESKQVTNLRYKLDDKVSSVDGGNSLPAGDCNVNERLTNYDSSTNNMENSQISCNDSHITGEPLSNQQTENSPVSACLNQNEVDVSCKNETNWNNEEPSSSKTEETKENNVYPSKDNVRQIINAFYKGINQEEKNSDSEVNIAPLFDNIKTNSDDTSKNVVRTNNNVKKEDTESKKYLRRSRIVADRELSNKMNYSYRQDGESECSVQSCLSQFTVIEIMTGANRVSCSTCTARLNKGNKDGKTVCTMASKQLLIKKVPQVLVLHLKRFQVQMYAFRKLSKHVSFPIYLDLSPFCRKDIDRDEDGRIMYSLYGVVEHSGNLNGGHYVAYVKVEEEESSRWFCISDSCVHEVSENRVLQSQAYLLFYKRLSTDHQDETS